jgi:hypothetical protein
MKLGKFVAANESSEEDGPPKKRQGYKELVNHNYLTGSRGCPDCIGLLGYGCFCLQRASCDKIEKIYSKETFRSKPPKYASSLSVKN